MKRLTRSLAFLAPLSLPLVASSACSTQECTYLNDCAGGQMCSPEGACIVDDRPAVGTRVGGGEVDRSDDDADDLDDGDVGIGDVGMPQEAIMSGTIGPIGGFDGPATMNIWNDTEFNYSWIDVSAESPEGWGLFVLTLPRGIASLPVGVTVIGPEGANDGETYAQLCSNGDGLHFDGIAEDTIITVTPNDDDGVDVDIESTISEGFDGSSYEGAAPTVVNVRFTLAG